VAGDRHRHPFRHPRVDHVPDSGAAKVVAELAGQASLLAGRNPPFAEVDDARALMGAGEVGEEVGDDPPGLQLKDFDARDLGFHKRHEVWGKVDDATVVILRLERLF
jgi:hypothetical protein